MESIKISIFKNLYKSQDVPYDISLEKIFKRIKEGKSKDKIKRLREITNSSESNEDLKKEKEKIKKSLPCILFSGVFKQRNGNSLVCHSGLMITDFDKYENKERMLEDLSILKKNKHIVSVFISPSGNGIKAVVKIPVTDKQIHPKYFKEFQKKFNFEYWDNSNSNVDRVCFESYDPDIYINYNAEVFNPVLRDEGFSVHERVSLIPITNEDAIIDKIMDFNWKKDFVKGERNNYIFDIAGAFCEYGVSQYMAEGYIQNNITYGDFTENEVRNTVKSAYKKRSFGSKYFEDYGKLNRVKKDLHKGKNKVLSKYKISEEVYNDIKEVVEHDDFWYFEETKQGTKVKIDSLKYKIFLETNGFKKYYPGDAEKPTFVFIQSNKVSETSEAKIKDFVLDYLLKGGHNSVYKRVVDYQNLFSENFLLLLDTIELLLLKDTKEKSFIAFQNGVLEVTKDSVELVDYIDIDGYIWSKQIINRDFVFSDNIENDYKKFINNISNNEPLAVETAIGYLLSTYKNKRDNKAIILNDEVISDNPEGGTGKGLFVQGIQEIRKVAILDGKSFDDKKSFPYQTVTQDTQTLVFDDVKKNFDFESKFSLVTEGLTLERKNKDAVKLTVEESPKLVISTNYARRIQSCKRFWS